MDGCVFVYMRGSPSYYFFLGMRARCVIARTTDYAHTFDIDDINLDSTLIP